MLYDGSPLYPVWRHGDWLTLTSRGTAIVHGRSDSTINRNGVRMGSADIYAAVESIPEVADCLIVGAELADGDYYMPLLVTLAGSAKLDDDLRDQIRNRIRGECSPRNDGLRTSPDARRSCRSFLNPDSTSALWPRL